MTPSRPVSDFASIVERNTRTLEDSLRGSPGADFSLAFGAPPQLDLSASLQATRGELLEAIDELRARILGPVGYFMTLLLPNPALAAVFHILYAFNVPSNVPLLPNGEITYKDLAERCGIPEDDTRRVVQTAITFRVFEEAIPEISVKHNGLSALLTNPQMNDCLGLIIEEQHAGTAKLVENLRRFPGSGEPGHSASVLALKEAKAVQENEVFKNMVIDPSRNFFDLIADDEKRVARFRSAMGMSTKLAAYSSTYFVDNLPWADKDQCPETIADIGGAGGELCQQCKIPPVIFILEHVRAVLEKVYETSAYPGVKKAVVLDLPEVIAGATAPEDLEDRLEYASYNFLTETVTQKADAYVFRHIFHDWSDQYAAKILKNLVPALKKGSKIWACEVVLPILSDKNHTRSADIFMKAGFNGKERSKRGWEALVAAADQRLRIANIISPEGANDSVIEIVFDD
ncbi:hypothetical protein AAE478_003298 [Parahypoxylon ruwenzoriense]